jgi:hypothetical protein
MNVLPKIGKFITGVCHPGQRLDLIREAGMDWVRIDVPFPYPKGQWGQWGEPYLQFRQKCRDYGAKGLRVMCVSPFPRDFARAGIDPASREGLEKVRAVCGALAED